jgi:hypothetical protein
MNTLHIEWENWPGLERKKRQGRGANRWTNSPLGWQGDQSKRTRIIEEMGFEIIGASEDGHRLDIVCINEENHSRDSGERQCCIYLGTDEVGVPAYKCFHSHCDTPDEVTGKSVNREQTEQIKIAFAAAETIFYRAGDDRIHETQARAFQLMRDSGEFFNLNNAIVRWREIGLR